MKVARAALCVASIGLALLGGLAASAASAAGPKLVVTPSTNLHNGEAVKVSGTGFKAGDAVYIVECLYTAKGESNCNILNTVPATISKSGALPASRFKVATGKIGNGKCGTTTKNLRDCAVSVGNESGGDSAVFRIIFKSPAKK
ncbi:MAG: neocarzinostatin apoprotein domain-containing protein [Acidimicrobiales bacterium]